MPLRLTNAPNTFQAVMNDVFREYLDDFVMLSIDNILIFIRAAADHLKHVGLILARLRQHKLFANLSKCEVNRSHFPFLGHVVVQGGVELQQSTVQALTEWPQFNHGFRSAVLPGSGKLLPPIHPGLRPHISYFIRAGQEECPVRMGGGQDNYFQNLKDAVISAPLLNLAHPKNPYIITCDASDIGIASLKQEIANGPHPVAFVLRKLSSAEKNYPVHEREFLAIVYALKEWRPPAW
jgi:hypothetical protein